MQRCQRQRMSQMLCRPHWFSCLSHNLHQVSYIATTGGALDYKYREWWILTSETWLVFDGKGVGGQNSSQEAVSCDFFSLFLNTKVISHYEWRFTLVSALSGRRCWFSRASFVPSAKNHQPLTFLGRRRKNPSRWEKKKWINKPQRTWRSWCDGVWWDNWRLVWCDVKGSLDASATVFLMGKENPSKKIWIQVGDENFWDQGMISGATRKVRIGSIRSISFYANKGSIVNLLSLESNPSCKCYMMLERDYGQLNQRDALLGKQIAPFWILFDSHYTYP